MGFFWNGAEGKEVNVRGLGVYDFKEGRQV